MNQLKTTARSAVAVMKLPVDVVRNVLRHYHPLLCDPEDALAQRMDGLHARWDTTVAYVHLLGLHREAAIRRGALNLAARHEDAIIEWQHQLDLIADRIFETCACQSERFKIVFLCLWEYMSMCQISFKL